MLLCSYCPLPFLHIIILLYTALLGQNKCLGHTAVPWRPILSRGPVTVVIHLPSTKLSYTKPTMARVLIFPSSEKAWSRRRLAAVEIQARRWSTPRRSSAATCWDNRLPDGIPTCNCGIVLAEFRADTWRPRDSRTLRSCSTCQSESNPTKPSHFVIDTESFYTRTLL